MKVSKAIEVNKDTLHQYEKHLLSDQRDAFKLSIEALKRVKLYRGYDLRVYPLLLPGETPEEEI